MNPAEKLKGVRVMRVKEVRKEVDYEVINRTEENFWDKIINKLISNEEIDAYTLEEILTKKGEKAIAITFDHVLVVDAYGCPKEVIHIQHVGDNENPLKKTHTHITVYTIKQKYYKHYVVSSP
mgnify:CR=1 FL=1